MSLHGDVLGLEGRYVCPSWAPGCLRAARGAGVSEDARQEARCAETWRRAGAGSRARPRGRAARASLPGPSAAVLRQVPGQLLLQTSAFPVQNSTENFNNT